jgi:hypothetical protein
MKTLHDETAADLSADIYEMPELSRFIPYIGEKFDVSSLRQGSLQIELVEAKALPGHAGEPHEDSFSLVFRAPNGCGLAQGSVALNHEKVGWVVLFLVPIGKDEDGRYFEAVFK